MAIYTLTGLWIHTHTLIGLCTHPCRLTGLQTQTNIHLGNDTHCEVHSLSHKTGRRMLILSVQSIVGGSVIWRFDCLQVRLKNPSSEPVKYKAFLLGEDAHLFSLPAGSTITIPPKYVCYYKSLRHSPKQRLEFT